MSLCQYIATGFLEILSKWEGIWYQNINLFKHKLWVSEDDSDVDRSSFPIYQKICWIEFSRMKFWFDLYKIALPDYNPDKHPFPNNKPHWNSKDSNYIPTLGLSAIHSSSCWQKRLLLQMWFSGALIPSWVCHICSDFILKCVAFPVRYAKTLFSFSLALSPFFLLTSENFTQI